MGLHAFVLAFALSAPEVDLLLVRCLDELHTERFDTALATAAEMQRRWPHHPAGYLAAANVHQTRMRDYRVRGHEPAFQAELQRALLVSERMIDAHPGAEAFFARGTARAYQAVHRFAAGDWVRGVLDAIHGVADARKALSIDKGFADPLLAVALHDFWKAEKLGLGLGLFGGGASTVVARLERVRNEARFLSVEAAYALQTVHYRRGELARALEANQWLHTRFPHNVVGLYHRGLILEALGRDAESLAAWDALLARLTAHPQPSDGFLAECQLHRARLLERRADTESARAAATARHAAWQHAAARVASRELEGPLVSFEDVQRDLAQLARVPGVAAARLGR